MKIAVVTGAIALLFAAPLSAQEGVYGHWVVWSKENGSTCSMRVHYESGASVILSYNAKLSKAVVGLMFENATSLQDGQEMQLGITFLKGGDLDEGWGEREFSVSVGDSFQAIVSEPLSSEILTDFAESSKIAFSRKGAQSSLEFSESDLIGVYILNGSAVAAEALRNCAIDVAGLNREDPFIQ